MEKGYNEASVELVTKSGERIPVECRASIVRTEKGEIEKMVVSELPVSTESRNRNKVMSFSTDITARATTS